MYPGSEFSIEVLQQRIELVFALIEQRRFDAATERILRLGADYPEETFVEYLWSVLALEQQDFTRAERHARAACAGDVTSADAYNVLAGALLGQHRAPEALPIIREALRLEPQNPFHHARAAAIWNGLDRYREAAVAATEGLRCSPNDPSCLSQLLVAQAGLAQFGRSKATAQALLAIDPEHTDTHNAAGHLALFEGNWAAAERHFLEALRQNPLHPQALSGLRDTCKARFPLYRWLYRYRINWSEVPAGRRLVIFLLLGGASVAMPLLIPVLLAGLFINWLSPAIATATLLFRSTSRNLIPHGRVVLVAAIGVALCAATGFATLSYTSGNWRWITVALSATPLVVLLHDYTYLKWTRYTPYKFGAWVIASLALMTFNIDNALSISEKVFGELLFLVLLIAYLSFGPEKPLD